MASKVRSTTKAKVIARIPNPDAPVSPERTGNPNTGRTPRKSAPKSRAAANTPRQRVKQFGGDNMETQIAEWLDSDEGQGVSIDQISYAYTSPLFHGAMILYRSA